MLPVRLQPAHYDRGRQHKEQIQRVWLANFQVYGVGKVWHALRNQQIAVACITIAPLKRQLGLGGVICDKTVPTTVRGAGLSTGSNRQCSAPHRAGTGPSCRLPEGLTHYCDRDVQYVSMRSTQCLKEAGIVREEARAILTTMRWLQPSTDCTKLR